MTRSLLGVVLSMILLTACAAPAATPTLTPVTPATSSPTATPSATLAPTATPQATAAPLTGWRLEKIPPAGAGPWATPVAVAEGEGRLVAVGGPVMEKGVVGGAYIGSIWTSIDGLTWTPVELDPVLFKLTSAGAPTSGPQPGLKDVAYGPRGFVVLGYAATDQGTSVVIWRSTDGLAWESLDLPESLFEGARPTAVMAAGPGYVIVGAWLDPIAPNEGAAPPRAAVWTSSDGRTWTRVPNQTGFGVGGYIDTGEGAEAGGMLDVTATATGLVAIGQTCRAVNLMQTIGRTTCRPLVWTSPDATIWTRIDPDVTAHQGSVPSIAAAGDRIVAVGGGWRSSPVRYTLRSPDGTTWRWDEDPGQANFEGIVDVLGTFVATSHESDQIGLWASADGRTWRPVRHVPTLPEGPSLRDSDLVAMDDRVVVVGWREDHEHPDASGFALVGPLETE